MRHAGERQEVGGGGEQETGPEREKWTKRGWQKGRGRIGGAREAEKLQTTLQKVRGQRDAAGGPES